MIADRYGENPLGLLLLDHKTIEVVTNFLGFPIKAADRIEPFFTGRLDGRIRTGIRRLLFLLSKVLGIGLHRLHERSESDLHVLVVEKIAELLVHLVNGIVVVFLGHLN